MTSLSLAERLQQANSVLNPELLRHFRNWFSERGGEITTTDIRQFPIPLPLYAQANLFGTFDGSTVYLHEHEEEVGGGHYSTLDALHLGMHCVQMSLPTETASSLGLKYDKQRSMAEIYNVDINEKNMPTMIAYEAEAHSMILGWVRSQAPELEESLKKANMTQAQLEEVLHDFYAADLTYVEHVLSHNELPLLQDFMDQLDKSKAPRARFEEIKKMIKPVVTQKIEGTFLEKLPQGEIIFGVRGPQSESLGSIQHSLRGDFPSYAHG
jgi:hypothetical protein